MSSDDGIVAFFANKLGTPEPAFRLVLSLVLGYPIAFAHRKFVYGKSPTLQHIYFICTGLLLGYFNFGNDIVHALSSVAITYGILRLLGGGTLSLALVFVYSMSHLLIGYWTTATRDYDIKWTMPHCVLTLRLIGLAFNLSDGREPEEKLSAENKLVALREMPSILEVFAHSFFPSSFLIGPQFPLRKYRDFVEVKLQKNMKPHDLPDSVRSGIVRGTLGLLYLLIHLVGSAYVSDEYLTSTDFQQVPMWWQFLVFGFWARMTLYKYISCWLITEGACIVTGLTYNGTDSAGKEKWDGCSNVKISVFETATKMDHYIDSFNINTNHWVAQYIYKRLKFLNNKTYSQFGVLLFLAVWHGFHSGYYICFFYEFIAILAEKTLTPVLARNETVWNVVYAWPQCYLLRVVLQLYTFISMGYAMIPFTLLKSQKYVPLFFSLRFIPHVFYLAIIFLKPYYAKYLFPPRHARQPPTTPSRGSNVPSSDRPKTN